jgi:hypothetical protein
VALFGTLLLAPEPLVAGLLLLFGYGAVAGLVPFKPWSVAMAGEGVMPGAEILGGLLGNVPLLLFERLHLAPPLLVAVGLAVLLICAAALPAVPGWRQCVALSTMAQFGLAVCAIGVGAPMVAWLAVTALALIRLAVLLSRGEDLAGWILLALLPLYVLYLLAAPAVWLAPLAVGGLLASGGMLGRQPVGMSGRWTTMVPLRLQLALACVLTCVTPGPVVTWLRAVAAG